MRRLRFKIYDSRFTGTAKVRLALYMVYCAWCVTFFQPVKAQSVKPPFITVDAAHWADSVIYYLQPDERIAQLTMVAAWSNNDTTHSKSELDSLITHYKIGGLIFFQGGPVRQVILTNYYQSISKTPLLIGIDGEWGLAMRLDSTIRFPRQMTLSAIRDDDMIYKMGAEIACECNRLGIHLNFSPDADINNNPANPIIGSRSFGDEREMVTHNAIIYMNALQDNRLLATAKHFPGHGNTDTDSHLALPLINQTKWELDSVELYPFRKMIDAGVASVMVAHLNVPAYDSVANQPSTLSSGIVTDLLKEKMGFKGIVFTDALNMKGITANAIPGVVDKQAFLAGNDVLLYSEDVPKAIEQIHLAVENCEIKQEEIDARVKKVLMAKYWCGLNHYQPVDLNNIYEDLNMPLAKLLQQQLYEKALTLLSNKDSIIPLIRLDTLKIASVVIGNEKSNYTNAVLGEQNAFQEQLLQYARVDCYALPHDASSSAFQAVKNSLSAYNLIILSLHGTTMNAAKNFHISEASIQFINEVLEKHNVIFVDFGNAYTLSKIYDLSKAKAVLLAYEDMPVVQNAASQLLFGGIASSGHLPVEASSLFHRNKGIGTTSPVRLKYTLPEEVGLQTHDLSAIDSIALKAIKAGAMPGCQVLVAKDGKVVYNKSFGTHTYNDATTVTNKDLYDIASVTKIASTCLVTMNLYEQGMLDLNQPLSKYLTASKNTNKKNIIIRDMLAHQAGLQSWIPFWKFTMDGDHPSNTIYHKEESKNYSYRVADNLYINNSYEDSIMQWVYDTKMGERGKYLYSDLGPILMKAIIEQSTSTALDKFVEQKYYRPLGLHNITFKPREKFELKRIIPTEDDTAFRKQLIHGDVHDPAAAMLGGVSGNAGLFCNANDLAVIMQLLLNRGLYGGTQYFKQTTVNLFTKQQFPGNRRGLLFDKPEPDSTKSSPTCRSASLKTFGHQGFTGTCVWVDPQYNLIYIFLSNRVNPDASNDKLVKMNVRTDIQQVIYDAINR